MQSQSQLFEALFRKSIDDNDSTAFLADITNRFPYFTPAQFYLLQQTGDNDQQAAQTALLFNNPHWLNFRISNKDAVPQPAIIIDEAPSVQEEAPVPIIAEEPVKENTAEPVLPAVSQPVEPERVGIAAAALEATRPEAMLFEPMHMVDYFASQGIKLSDDAQMGDKLGKQLRSFTEWLKTMKKVHADKLPETAPQNDIAVQKLAEKSNTEDEIVTESMAEVFAMQGKTAKAIDVYEKLSLLNPSKSAFFAAKIEQLKG